jgi:hypothetical protein
MDHPFSRGLPDNCPPRPSLSWSSSSSSSYRPLSSSYFSRPRHDPSGSHHPPTPPSALPGVPVPGPFPVRSDPVRKITPPEEKGIYAEDRKIEPQEEGIHAEDRKIAPQEEEIHAKDEKLAIANEYKSPYDKAYACVQEFRKGGSARYPLGDYEESHAIKLSRQDWFKLRTELNLEESDG